jgi:choline dehydrogenase-like flavoprotein
MEGYDVVVVGGGSAGCVLAARLSEDPDRSVCLIEAGPDYGPYAEGRWPNDLLNAYEIAVVSHDWGIEGGWPFWRARVLGGCSAHNACLVVWGPPADYDEWGQAGNPGWSHAALDPYRRRCEQALRTRPSRIEDLDPFNRAGLEGAVELGLPLLEDFDDPRFPRARRRSRSTPSGPSAGTRRSPISTRPEADRTCRSWRTPWSIGCTWRGRGSPGCSCGWTGSRWRSPPTGWWWPPVPTARPRCCCAAAWDRPRSWPRRPSRFGPSCPGSDETWSTTRRWRCGGGPVRACLRRPLPTTLRTRPMPGRGSGHKASAALLTAGIFTSRCSSMSRTSTNPPSSRASGFRSPM